MRKLLSLLVGFFAVVTLQAQPSNDGGCTADFTAIVDDYVVSLSGSATIEDSTDTVVEWFWTGATGVGMTGQDVSMIFQMPGIYSICLVITTENGCDAISCQDILINDDGTGGTDSTACYIWAGFFATTNGTTTTFTDFSQNNGNSGLTWVWDFGDGNTATDQNPTHTYSEDGTYDVCLTVTDADGCSDTNCQSISTANAPIECFTITSGSAPYAADDSIFLEVIAEDSFCCTGNWDGICQDLYDAIASGNNGGGNEECTAFFYHTASDSIGWDPIGLPSGLTVSFWDGGSWGASDWSWDFGDGNTGSGPQVVHEYAAAGTYTVCLTITGQDGCTASYCEDIVVSDEEFCYVVIYAQPTTDIPLTFEFFSESWTNDQAGTWEWDFGDATTSNEANPVHTFNQYGDYEVCLTYTTSTGCTATSCQTFSLTDPADCEAHFWTSAFPADSIGIDSIGIIDPVGTGLTVSFWDCSLGSPTDWTWDFGDGNTGSGPFIDHTYAAAGTYTVCLTITNDAGCESTTCQDIIVDESQWDNCYAEFSYYPMDSTASGANGFQFQDWSSNNTISWAWDFGDGNTSNEQNPLHIYAEDGIYTVCLTIVTDDQCISDMCVPVLVGDDGWEPTGLSLCGSVNVANNFNAPTTYDATVYLIQYDEATGTLTAIDSTIAIGFGWGQDDSSSFSFYCFDGLEEGNYMVKAAMNEWSPLYEDYLPTYYDGVLSWMNATTVSVTEDTFGIDINMVAGDNPGGPGFIGGSIADGAGKSLSELGGIMVILIDAEGNPVGFIHTDEEGSYSFENVAYGTYTIHVEILNIPSEQNTVSIHEENPNASDVNFVLHSSQVTTDFSNSIEELMAVGINNFALAPNPVQNQAVLKFNAEQNMQATLRIFNLMGQNVQASELNIEAGSNAFEVDASRLAEGMYLIDLSQNGQSIHQIKVMKQ